MYQYILILHFLVGIWGTSVITLYQLCYIDTHRSCCVLILSTVKDSHL